MRIVEAAHVIAEGLAVEVNRFRHIFHVHNCVCICRLQVRCHSSLCVSLSIVLVVDRWN